MADSLDVKSKRISNMADPESDQDAATKAYVDAGELTYIKEEGTELPFPPTATGTRAMAMMNFGTGSGDDALAIGGVAAGDASVCGQLSTANGDHSAAFMTATVHGDYSFGAGKSAVVNEDYGTAYGPGAISNNYAEFAIGFDDACNGAFFQQSQIYFKGTTTNATPTEIFLDDPLFALSEQAKIFSSTLWRFVGTGIASDTSNDKGCSFEINGLMRSTSAGNTSMVSTPTVTKTYKEGDGSMDSVDIDIAADDTDDVMTVTVTGKADTTIKWGVHFEITQLRWS